MRYPIPEIILLVVLLPGCATKWEPYWHEAGSANPSVKSMQLMDSARAKYGQADSKIKLQNSIAAYEKVIASDPGNIEALTGLSSQYVLLGTAYTDKRSVKKRYFRDAMKYAELAMYTNPDFKKVVDSGAAPWEAVETLTDREVEAAMLWVTALQYEFDEVMRLPGKIINVKRLKNTMPVLKRIENVAPGFGGGSIELALAINYFSLPAGMGGNDELGEIYMNKAVQYQNDWMVGRWARGRYYTELTGNNDGVKEDLEWVASRDITQFKDPYPWLVHFRNDARRLLDR